MKLSTLLEPWQKFGITLGLDRITQLLDRLGNPQNKFPIIHVAGTNGKGSVCAYLSSVLAAADYRLGLYTSPHLVRWTERIQVNNQEITEGKFCEYVAQVIGAIAPEWEPPTVFEITTAAAFLCFADQGVDVAVIEVGLGGRLDSTNVCDRPLVSVITSISREHWQRLGNTLAQIAGEKAGIIKPGRPVVAGILPPEAAAVVTAKSEDCNAPLQWVPPATPLKDPPQPMAAAFGQKSWAHCQGWDYPLALEGEMQLQNSALAIAVVQELIRQGWKLTEAIVRQGMAQTRWPGRLQWLTWENHPLLIDGAHNPAAAQYLGQYVHGRFPRVTWIMGMLAVKEHRKIFQALLRPGDRLYLMPVGGHSSADPQALATLAQDVCPQAIVATFDHYLPALHQGKTHGDPMIFCGSLYLIGEFLKDHGPTP